MPRRLLSHDARRLAFIHKSYVLFRFHHLHAKFTIITFIILSTTIVVKRMTALFLFFCKKIYPLPDFLPKNYNSLKFWGLFTHSEPHLPPHSEPPLPPHSEPPLPPPPWEGGRGVGAVRHIGSDTPSVGGG